MGLRQIADSYFLTDLTVFSPKRYKKKRLRKWGDANSIHMFVNVVQIKNRFSGTSMWWVWSTDLNIKLCTDEKPRISRHIMLHLYVSNMFIYHTFDFVTIYIPLHIYENYLSLTLFLRLYPVGITYDHLSLNCSCFRRWGLEAPDCWSVSDWSLSKGPISFWETQVL